jgi:phage baseplate assembly protein W
MDFIGAPYPIRLNPKGFLYAQKGVNLVKSDLLQLLLTNPGERVMLPQYGTPLRDLVFDPNDAILAEKAQEMIANSINLWEPRITVQDIEVYNNFNQDLNPKDTGQEIPHILGIRITFFDPENIASIQQLQLEIPLANGQ